MEGNSIFKRVVQEFKDNKLLREQGKDLVIPWLSLPKLNKVLPGVQKGRYIIVTANSKVGKTQLADYLFLYEPINFIYTHYKTNIKLKIFYFSLEMSKEEKVAQMISHKILKDTGKAISTEDLKSYFQDYILEDSVLETVEKYVDYFKFIEQHLFIADNIRNPFGIYRTVREHARQNGKFYRKDGTQVTDFNGEDGIYEYYVPNDPDEHVIVITDHVSLLHPEQGEKTWDAMLRFSNMYCLKMRDNFKYTVVNIQQQAADQEKQQFTFKGTSITDKVRPSPDGLGDCKLTGRDVDLMLGLFAPARYRIQEYAGYDIRELKDNYREMSILLNRRGGGGINLDLFFDGSANYFAELEDRDKIIYADKSSWIRKLT